MIGIVYSNDSKQIAHIIPDVVQYTETDVIGKGASVKGIDLTQASFCIVAATDLQVGDVLGEFTDGRHQLMPSQEDRLRVAEDWIMEQMMIQMMGGQ